MFECVQKKVEASEETARSEQDLTAQQRAATSALISAIASALTLLVSGVGVFYVKRTLDATLKAVEDTSEATDAMRVSNWIAEKAQRAWIGISEAYVSNIYAIEAGDEYWIWVDFIFVLKNSGHSPALNIRSTAIKHWDQDQPPRDMFEFFNLSWDRGSGGQNIAPGHTLKINRRIVIKLPLSATTVTQMCAIAFAYDDGVAKTRRQTSQTYHMVKRAEGQQIYPFEIAKLGILGSEDGVILGHRGVLEPMYAGQMY